MRKYSFLRLYFYPETDTFRQIADLRARGEFEKADKILSISQDYLTKFSSLEKWAQEPEAMGWSEPQYRQWRMSNPGVGDLYQ